MVSFGRGGKRDGAGAIAKRPRGRPVAPTDRRERIARAQSVAEYNSEAAVRLLARQFRDKELSPKDRREAAIAVLKTANLPEITAEELDRYGAMTRGSLELKIQNIINGTKSQIDGSGTPGDDKKSASRGIDTIDELLDRVGKSETVEQDRIPSSRELPKD